MRPQHRSEVGETLIEVLISLVVIGIIVSAFFAAIATTSNASKTHRDLVSADAMLRDSAELTKTAVRRDCDGGTTYAVTYSSLPPRLGFTYPADVTNQPCPSVAVPGDPAAQVPTVTLTVTTPGAHTKSLAIMVRTP